MKEEAGTCAGLMEGGKFFIKIWLMEYASNIRRILQTT
jgi:hypothetical protein